MAADSPEAVEEMAAFFDARAKGYDQHIRGYVFTEADFVSFYQAVASPIPQTDAPLEILDLGCGTGLEIEYILARAPNARITGVDVAAGMLALLRQRYAGQLDQIHLINDSYLTMELGSRRYDLALSAMTIHHLLSDDKRALYARIRAALKPGGFYIEGDSVTPPEMEAQFLAEYREQIDPLPQPTPGQYHIDIPLSLNTQRRLLLEAGFREVDLLWQRDPLDMWNAAVYVAHT